MLACTASLMQMKNLSHIVRALRLPFITASILPFTFGSLIVGRVFDSKRFLTGLIAVIATHLAANLMNDYADSKSGVDSIDPEFYGLFGGSKLIQRGVFSERFYLMLSLFFASVAVAAVVFLSITMGRIDPVIYYSIIIAMSYAYSIGPLSFSYRMAGEIAIFILFGPVLVMGGYFIQSGIFPDLRAFALSLPFGFMIAALLFANEVPDFSDDLSVGKHNLVKLVSPERAYLLYIAIVAAGYISILFCVSAGYMPVFALATFLFIPLPMAAASIIKRHFRDKKMLLNSSRLTIAMNIFLNLTLLGSAFI